MKDGGVDSCGELGPGMGLSGYLEPGAGNSLICFRVLYGYGVSWWGGRWMCLDKLMYGKQKQVKELTPVEYEFLVLSAKLLCSWVFIC